MEAGVLGVLAMGGSLVCAASAVIIVATWEHRAPAPLLPTRQSFEPPKVAPATEPSPFEYYSYYSE